MISLRSAVALAVALLFGTSPVLAQGRILDEGTFQITRRDAQPQTESFRIRTDNGAILITGQLVAGTHRVTSALTTDSVGTPVDYKLEVRDNGTSVMTVSATARSGRLMVRSQLARGDESTREYPVVAGRSLIVDDELVHQLYLVALAKRAGAIQVIHPRSSRGGNLTLTALGLEPLTIGGRQVTTTHYSLANGGVKHDFWIDAAGRLMQVEVPSSGLKAVRDDLPR